MPELYVVAGTNGVGKTTAFESLVPVGIDFINADIIAKTIREQTGGLNAQDLANQEAGKLFYEKVARNISFAIETNLYDIETYRSLQGVQNLGYTINLIYVGVEDIAICNSRIQQRVKQGGHFVNPDVVRQRYETGLKLLKHYKDFPDKLLVYDNTEGFWTQELELQKGKIIQQSTSLKRWSESIIESEGPEQSALKEDSVEAVRKLYRKKKGL